MTDPADPAEEPGKNADITKREQAAAEPLSWDPPVSPEWKKDRRRNGAAITSLFDRLTRLDHSKSDVYRSKWK
jgi:hypothetical protein